MNYILIKDLPDLKKGAVFEQSVDGLIYYHEAEDGDLKIYKKNEMTEEWFRKETN